MGKYKKSYKSNKFKRSTLTWNEEFELPGGDYFEYMLKRHGDC